MDRIYSPIRKEIIGEINRMGIKCCGSMKIIDFLDRVFNLKASQKEGYCSNAYQELKSKIEYRNLDEAPIFKDSLIDLENCADDIFLRFLSETLHPSVRNDFEEKIKLSKMYNSKLHRFGCDCYEIDEMGGIHQILYKYTTCDRGLDIIKSGTIKFSSPTEFNDPFDCRFPINTNFSDIKLDRCIDKLAEKDELTLKQKTEIRNRMQDATYKFKLTNAIKEVSQEFGIACFSKQSDNLLMWAHYANDHKGIVMKFDTFKDANFFMNSFPIDYVTNFRLFQKIVRCDFLKEKKVLGKFIAETKSNDWLYEDEVRVMKQGCGFRPINKNAVSEIIFGCQSSGDDKANFVKEAKKNGWNHLKFSLTSKKDWEFGLDFSDYKTM
jgi:hypothetical protein